ncbi:MAG: hypothetical protein IT287_00445 [Bdellovibrionaceae bacterium]|nr:hypothetical protein [Pseudobdellovibrionaceae bacterium]
MDSNPMAQFLNFPKSIAEEATHGGQKMGNLSDSFDFSAPSPQAPLEPISLSESPIEENTSEFNLSALLDEPSDMDSLTRPAIITSTNSTEPIKSLFDDLAIDAGPSTNQEAWKEKDLSQFELPPDKSDDLDQFEALNLSIPTAPTEKSSGGGIPMFDTGVTGVHNPQALISEPSLDRFSLSKTVLPPKDNTNTATKSVIIKPEGSDGPLISAMSGMNDSEIEAIVRAHTEEVIKNQIQDSLIHVVEKIVREELNRIMEEEIRLQQDADFES